MTRRRWWLVLFITTFAITASYLLFLLPQPSRQEHEIWVPIEPQVIEKHLGLVGRLHASNQITLAAPFDSIIQEVLVNEGEQVEQNQTLLTLDPSQLEIQMRQAQAELLKTQSTLQKLQNWAQSPEVNRARRTVTASEQVLNNTQSNLYDTMALFKAGIVARMEVDTLRQQQHSQRQDLNAAKDELAIILAKGQGEELKIAEMESANAEARYQALENLYQGQKIVAPINGFIVRPITQEGGKPITLQKGLQVSQGTPLLNIIEQRRFQVRARVEETDLHLLEKKMIVRITGDGFSGQELSGAITSIAMQGQASEMQSAGAWYDVIVTINDIPERVQQLLRIGMSAQVVVILYQNERGMVVPPEALHIGETGGSYVWYRTNLNAPPERINVIVKESSLIGIEVGGLNQGLVRIN